MCRVPPRRSDRIPAPRRPIDWTVVRSGMGRVSRAPQELPATRNCTRDEGGPFEFGSSGRLDTGGRCLARRVHRRALRGSAASCRSQGGVGRPASNPGPPFEGWHWRRTPQNGRSLQRARCRSPNPEVDHGQRAGRDRAFAPSAQGGPERGSAPGSAVSLRRVAAPSTEGVPAPQASAVTRGVIITKGAIDGR